MTTPQILQPIPPGDGSGGVLPSSFVIGDILYADSTSTLHTLADVAVGSVLVSGGVGAAPAWSATSASKFGSVAIGGATIGTDALAVTGTFSISGAGLIGGATVSGGMTNPLLVVRTAGASKDAIDWQNSSASNIGVLGSDSSGNGLLQVKDSGATARVQLGVSGGLAQITLTNSSSNAFITTPAAATLQMGAVDLDTAPIAQTLRSQGALAGGTSNVAGANWTFIASPGKGTGAGGSLMFQTAPAGSTGTVVNAPVTALTIDSKGLLIGGTSFTVATLPAAAAGNKGARSFITDGAAAPVFGAIVAGSGSLFLPVFSDGTNWRNG